ncbi:hypothetical protein [Cytobacillus pseudoceanisediminis]|uniref:hypothetical protein n=1 Tax=Cytobacillus pseudoceanisediminis TaxID=3051614 RepID=UPI003C309792
MEKKYTNLNEFIDDNHDFCSQPIVKSFINQPKNLSLLESAIIHDDLSAKVQLDEQFVEHFFLFRLIKYISTLSYYFSNDFDKQRRKQKEKYQLIIDKPSDNNKDSPSIIDIFSLKQDGESHNHSLETGFLIFDSIEDENLYEILIQLNKKEKEIIKLLVFDQLKQIEVAKLFNETPQNIAKTKKRIITKIRNQYKKQKGD